MNAISGVLFDIGGVLVGLDGVPSLAKLLQIEPLHEEIHRRWMACPSVVRHETGQIAADQFAIEVVQDLGLSLSPEAFLDEFAGWLTEPLPGAFALVDCISSAYRVAALSNVSAFHWNRIHAMGLPSRFDALYLSHEIGHLKPSPEAFQAALAGMALPASEVLFLDDGAANVEAARALGMEAHLVRGPSEAESVLHAYGVLGGPRARRPR
jgi:putative hydrolase of the HAD superfamily